MLPSTRHVGHLAPVKGLAFYEAAVQIIPVLLVVIALEVRVASTRMGLVAEWFVFLFLLYVFVAELIGLDVLYSGDGSGWKHTVVYLAVLVELAGILGLALPITTGTGRDSSRQPLRRK